jgi:hypothetical protein
MSPGTIRGLHGGTRTDGEIDALTAATISSRGSRCASVYSVMACPSHDQVGFTLGWSQLACTGAKVFRP